MFNRIVVLAGALVCALAGLVASASSVAAQQPQMTALRSDFVPGEKTILFDDFTDMNAGEAPKRFRVRGAAVELREGGGLRELAALQNTTLIPNVKALPKNFTYESQVKFDVPRGWAAANALFMNKGREALTFLFSVRPDGSSQAILAVKVPKYEELGRKPFKVDPSQPVALALWVQDGRVRVFVNNEKQLDINQVDVAPIDEIQLQPGITGAVAVAYRSVRFAESAPDVSEVLTASGRYVSHGILFDTDSDRLKLESGPVVQTIARALQANAALKLLIEGHTDSVGDAAHNMDLSKRRAEAVKGVLVSQFQIDGARLTTAGLGATRPVDSNDTPQGRALNRRVEFVRQ